MLGHDLRLLTESQKLSVDPPVVIDNILERVDELKGGLGVLELWLRVMHLVEPQYAIRAVYEEFGVIVID